MLGVAIGGNSRAAVNRRMMVDFPLPVSLIDTFSFPYSENTGFFHIGQLHGTILT